MATLQELTDSITGLTTEATAMVNLVAGQKDTLEAKVSSATESALATSADSAQTALDVAATNAAAIATASDRVQTALDATATNLDAIATAGDSVQTALDVTATNADAIATAADRVQTGLDVIAAGANKDAESLIITAPNGFQRTQKSFNYDYLTIADFGEVGGLNAAPAIQAMLADKGFFTLPEGMFSIQDELLLPNQQGFAYRGQGMERSVIQAVGMEGASAIKPASEEQYNRVVMSDFGVIGDCDTALNFTVRSDEVMSRQLYQSEFRNIQLSSQAGPSFVCNEHFSTAWYNVHFSSSFNNAIEIEGGNSTILQNCYVHKIGAGFAGYRILGNAVMISCNGVDENVNNCSWGHFGSLALNRRYTIQMIGCNMEDFNIEAIRLENFGDLELRTTSCMPRSTGTYGSIIHAINGSDHFIHLNNTNIQSKGATLGGAAAIISDSGSIFVHYKSKYVETGGLTQFYRADHDLLYDASQETIINSDYRKGGLRFSDVTTGIERGYRQPNVITAAADVSTIDATGTNVIQTANTVATNLRTITGFHDGQELTLLIKDSFTTVACNYGGTGRLDLKSGVNELAMDGDVYRFAASGNRWVQTGASFSATRITTITDGLSSPVLVGIHTLQTANTFTTTLNNVLNVVEGKELTLLIKDSFTTVGHGYAAGGGLILKSGVNELAVDGSVYKFVGSGTKWVQIGESYSATSVSTITDGLSSPLLAGFKTLKTANTFTTTINNIIGVVDGKELTLLIKDSFTTLAHGYAAGGELTLKSGANELAVDGSVYKFVGSGTKWVQI